MYTPLQIENIQKTNRLDSKQFDILPNNSITSNIDVVSLSAQSAGYRAIANKFYDKVSLTSARLYDGTTSTRVIISTRYRQDGQGNISQINGNPGIIVIVLPRKKIFDGINENKEFDFTIYNGTGASSGDLTFYAERNNFMDTDHEHGIIYNSNNQIPVGTIHYDYGLIVLDSDFKLSTYIGEGDNFFEAASGTIWSGLTGSAFRTRADREVNNLNIHEMTVNDKRYITNYLITCNIDAEDYNNSRNSSLNKDGTKVSDGTWISKIGLFDPENRLLAIGKSSIPIRKTNSRKLEIKLSIDT